LMLYTHLKTVVFIAVNTLCYNIIYKLQMFERVHLRTIIHEWSKKSAIQIIDIFLCLTVVDCLEPHFR